MSTNRPTNFDPNRLTELCEAAVEDRLSEAELSELEERVLQSPEARRFYTTFVSRHAVLVDYLKPYQGRIDDFLLDHAPLASSSPKKLFRHLRWLAPLSVLSVGIVICVAGFLFRQEIQVPEEPKPPMLLGTLTEIRPCVWGDDSDAMRSGGRIGSGDLDLQSGIAKINFDHGVALTLEGPSRISLSSTDRCFLHNGRIYAKVSPKAIGFVVETAAAEIKDLGTEFGVSIGKGENADVQVFSGRVDVSPKNQDQIIPITTGGWLRFDTSISTPLNPYEMNDKASFPYEKDETVEVVRSTAHGDGREACVVNGRYGERLPEMNSYSDIFTLLKNGLDPFWHRKAYFSIDLTSLSDGAYRTVRLELAFAPTGVGVLSYVPEVSTFTIYGLTDESLDFWDENTISWQNAPANVEDGASVDPEKTVKIASFDIAREDEGSRIVVSNEELQRFLSSDSNHRVTFIVVRETQEDKQSGYAHGFANRHHPKLPPPTLRFFR